MTRLLSLAAAAASLAVPIVAAAGWLRWRTLSADAKAHALGQHPAGARTAAQHRADRARATHLATVHQLHRIDTEADQ